MTRRYLSGRVVGIALAIALLTTACDDDVLMPPAADAGAMFARYVAIGNSITAGFQSGGINDSTQRQSYAVLLADALGTDFVVPLLNSPGCPPPYTNVFTQTRLGGLSDEDCYVRQAPAPRYFHNVAVPGAAAIDALDNLDPASGPNTLTALILGGRTQLEIAAEMQPTFVTVWIGNNDVLGAILSTGDAGSASLITSPTTFASRYSAMMDSLDAIGTIQGGVLIGVVQVGFAPYVTQGRVWKGFEATYDAMTMPLNALDVNVNCLAFQALGGADTAWTSVPFHYGGPLLALANARVDSVLGGTLPPGNLQTVTLDCSVAQVISATEMATMMGTVAAYNTAIEAEASENNRGWAFVDPNALLAQLVADPTAIRPFPAFDPTDPQHETAPFGSALSRDGIHPSASAHQAIAAAVTAKIDSVYGTSIGQ